MSVKGKSLHRLRLEREIALTREEFVFYRCFKDSARQEREAFYDYIVNTRAQGERINIWQYSKRRGISPTRLYAWCDVILGLSERKRPGSRAHKVLAYDETERDSFVNGLLKKNGERSLYETRGTKEQRARYYDWFVANYNNPYRESTSEIAEIIGVSQALVVNWQDRLGGFGVRRKASVYDYKKNLRERMLTLVDELKQTDRPLFIGEISKRIKYSNLSYEKVVEYLSGTPNEYLISCVMTMEIFSAGLHNEIVDYINEFERRNGRTPTYPQLKKEFFNYGDKVCREAYESCKRRKLTHCQQSALDWYYEVKEKEFQKEVTSAPYERDEDWLARVEDEGYKGFLFTGEYWRRYRALWEKKRARKLQSDESKVREEIRRGRDPLEAQCYGPTPKKKFGVVAEFIARLNGFAE